MSPDSTLTPKEVSACVLKLANLNIGVNKTTYMYYSTQLL